MPRPTYDAVVKALEMAIEVYQYASMTKWERECTQVDRDHVEMVLLDAKEVESEQSFSE